MKTGFLFMDATLDAMSEKLLQSLSSMTTALILKSTDLPNAEQLVLAASMREQGIGLALRNVDLAFLKCNGYLLSQASYILVCLDHPELKEICNYARQRPTPLRVIVENITSWRALADSALMGAYGFFEGLCQAPGQMVHPAHIAPQVPKILQLMQMVQANADIRHLEKVLKSDVTLTYMLLRYINSAGFGLEVKIKSPLRALTMLGYAPLFRWLLLLLARTNTSESSPALMQAAMVRGRFAELLGQGVLSPKEAENLFVVGMSSILDRAFSISVGEALGHLALTEGVAQALDSRDTLHDPFVALAEASERQDGGVAILAQALSLRGAYVNQAHLAAIAWAQCVKL